MNTSLPPEPVKKFEAPKSHEAAAVLAGAPIGALGVLLFEAHFSVKLETAAASVVGSCFAAFVGYIWRMGEVLLYHIIERSLNR